MLCRRPKKIIVPGALCRIGDGSKLFIIMVICRITNNKHYGGTCGISRDNTLLEDL
jgi:hypothetical protein